MSMNPQTQMLQMMETRANPPALPAILQGLSRKVKEQIADTLTNDEVSSEAEILEFWTGECGISKDVADAAITYRTQHLINPFFELFPDLFS